MIAAGSIERCARPYSQLAANYDATVGIPFFLRVRDAFEELIRRYGISFRTAADIGCGTGLFARYLKTSWRVPVTGVDLSGDMLRIAARNCRGLKIRLLRQDIRALRLPQPVDLITCNFDTLNHLVGDGDLRRAFRGVYNNLRPGGHFIFDSVTNCGPLGSAQSYVRRFRTQRRTVMQRVRWEPMRKLLSIVVSIRSPGRPRPILEVHRERAYSPNEIGWALQEAGFVIRGLHDAATLAMPGTCPPRIIVIARKKMD
jgi:SAM-dependent methyltransferase